jgi:hypothetical protein
MSVRRGGIPVENLKRTLYLLPFTQLAWRSIFCDVLCLVRVDPSHHEALREDVALKLSVSLSCISICRRCSVFHDPDKLVRSRPASIFTGEEAQ